MKLFGDQVPTVPTVLVDDGTLSGPEHERSPTAEAPANAQPPPLADVERLMAEVRWAAARSSADLWTLPDTPTLVVSCHPGDEVLGCGGLIATQRRRGVPVTVLSITDGEASHGHSVDPVLVRARRRGELLVGLRSLGVSAASVTSLSLPDGHLAEHEDTIAGLVADASVGHGLVVASNLDDGHPDHDAVGRAAAAGADADAELVQTVVNGWRSRGPSGLHRSTLHRIDLDGDAHWARRRAISAHVSQVTDLFARFVLGDDDLEPLDWPSEYLLRSERDGPAGG